MLMAADAIAEIVRRGRAEFDRNPMLRQARQRCLEILGEAGGAGQPMEPKGTQRWTNRSDCSRINPLKPLG